MKYLAILVYTCSCNEESYLFTKPIRFYAKTEKELEKKVRYLDERVPRKEELDLVHAAQCEESGPAEIFVFDEKFKLVRKW